METLNFICEAQHRLDHEALASKSDTHVKSWVSNEQREA